MQLMSHNRDRKLWQIPYYLYDFIPEDTIVWDSYWHEEKLFEKNEKYRWLDEQYLDYCFIIKGGEKK
jgi:hypothetical protein